MPNLNYHKANSIHLRDAGFDEDWLQERILESPSILGLGDLTVIQREKKQSSGGRIDFLMLDVETNKMYEVEVMLGKLDESHIIRTIEYWDIERRHWSDRQHYAVIVAEEITNRFFNIIGLFNRAIPVIAIQLNAVQVDDKIILNFTKVLDVYEPPEELVVDEKIDRRYWEGRSSAQSLKVVDQCAHSLASGGKKIQVNYRTSRITMEGNTGQIFAWFYPRRVQPNCIFHLRTGESKIAEIKDKLESAEVDVADLRKDALRLNLTPDQMNKYEKVVAEALVDAAKESEQT